MYLVWIGFTDTIISPNNVDVGFPKKKDEKEEKKTRALPEDKGMRRFHHNIRYV